MNDISEMKRKICDSIRILPVWIIFAIVTLTAVGCAPRQDELIIESESADTGEVETTKDISKDDAEKTEQTVQTVETLQADVFVHVCGAVKNPGVYVLHSDGHVCDAVSAAGGFTSDADEEYVNQAYPVSDGLKIVIPTVMEVTAMAETSEAGTISNCLDRSCEEAKPGTSEAIKSATDNSSGKININTADESGLCEIPGVGTKRASDIISYRNEHGQFGSIEAIMNVTGIKQGTFDKIKDYISVK